FLAISRNQWSPLVLASLWLPWAGAVMAAKPNVGLVTLAASTSRRGFYFPIASAAALSIAAFLVRPGWLGAWLHAIKNAPNKEVALLYPLGFLLLANVLRWRSADGRVLLAMSAVPQTPSLYDLLPGFVVAKTTRQAICIAALTHLVHWTVIALGPYRDFDSSYTSLERISVFLFLIPLMLMGFWNDRLGAKVDEDGRITTIDMSLLVVVAISLGVQLWLVFFR
ncbi:MAG: hypothetical protein ABIT38_01230, partial [Gemmatimonadaceae bacterium]